MIYPSFPEKNDVIGICAPSAGVGHKLESFDKSLRAIKNAGFGIKETASVRNNDIRSADAKTRAREFHSLISDPDVAAVIAATGGEYNYEVLPYLDGLLIKNYPKWFCGYSDPTNIEYYMTTVLDIATIYGVNAGSFDWEPLHEYQQNALSIISGDIVEQHSYDLWDSEKNWEHVDLNTPVRWELFNADSLNTSGRVIGGCTDVIGKLIGTPYDGTSGFIEKYKEDGFIWYFDTFEMNADNLYLTMMQMKYAGYFEFAHAIIFGRVMYDLGSQEQEYIDNLKRVFPDTPFIWGADIGHTKPAMTMINGSVAEIECRNEKCRFCIKLI